MEKKLIDNSLVLKEALSIPSCVNNFVKNDLNDYDEIAELIKKKKLNLLLQLQEVLLIVQHFLAHIFLLNILVCQLIVCPHL